VGRDDFALFLFLPKQKAKYFLRRGWTAEWPDSPTGKSLDGTALFQFVVSIEQCSLFKPPLKSFRGYNSSVLNQSGS
jgi:hypothetical protein